MKLEVDLNSLRAKKSRLARLIGQMGGFWLLAGAGLLALGGVILILSHRSTHLAYSCLAVSTLAGMLGLWYRRSLSKLPPHLPTQRLDDILEPALLAHFKKGPITPKSIWQAATAVWEGKFIINHLLIAPNELAAKLSDNAAEATEIWRLGLEILANEKATELHAGMLVTALIMSSSDTKDYLATLNLKPEDVQETYSWLERLNRSLNERRSHFGGIGRDWASGFTPTLSNFGQNISASVEAGHGHFHTLAHSDVLDSVIHSLSQPQGCVAIVGPAGTGKTSLVYALADRLLKGQDRSLLYFQIYSLNASSILATEAKRLEHIILALFTEAAFARNVIIFLDEAELFFGKGTGAIDISQILLPLLQNNSVKLITAFTPEEWQQLKSSHPSLSGYLTPIVINEPDEATSVRILEDSALTVEVRNHLLVSYQAVREAYRLSGQFMQDLAYPGKAISLLEQSIPYSSNEVMTAESVQQAVEKTRGVKVAKAEAPEADTLLHLEERIHQRMINQVRAVSVVSAALRRGRTGVADPRRPIGSFLFLGPTGVGKTELARSLAAVYFGDERQMIRLDMTEYQQSADVERLLDVGGPADKSLILQIREQPFSVVLLDEVEKANPAVLNLLLQLLDEGQLTDKAGRQASFRNAIVIATSNAGSAEIAQRVAAGDNLESFERPLIEKLISDGQFKAELMNRFDEIVLFRPLNQAELAQVAQLMLAAVNQNLAKQNVAVQLSEAAMTKLIQAGYDPQFGARPLRRVIQDSVEDAIATRILRGEAQPGTTVTLDVNDLNLPDSNQV